MIAENGTILARSKRFNNECVYIELDLERLVGERKKSNTYNIVGSEKYVCVKLDMNIGDTKITRYVDNSRSFRQTTKNVKNAVKKSFQFSRWD